MKIGFRGKPAPFVKQKLSIGPRYKTVRHSLWIYLSVCDILWAGQTASKKSGADTREQNDLFYVCSLIEYTARKTKNKRKVIVDLMGKKGIEKQLYDAAVNHCLSFEQVSDEWIEQYKIPYGNFDTISECKYSIPSPTDIGRLYALMIQDCAAPGDEAEEMIRIFSSFISEEISDFSTDLYYQNPSYLECSYKKGHLLD